MNRRRWGVRAVLAFGLVASILANIADADPQPISMIIAGITPFCLFLALELVTRLPVQRGRIAKGRWIATLGIAGIAAYVSYWHMVGTALRYGEAWWPAHLLPLAIDGLIIVATINLFELARPTEPEAKPKAQAIEPAPRARVTARNGPDRPQTVAAAVRSAADIHGLDFQAVLAEVQKTHKDADKDTVRRNLNRTRTNGHGKELADA